MASGLNLQLTPAYFQRLKFQIAADKVQRFLKGRRGRINRAFINFPIGEMNIFASRFPGQKQEDFF
jgi:hypothetical protein